MGFPITLSNTTFPQSRGRVPVRGERGGGKGNLHLPFTEAVALRY